MDVIKIERWVRRDPRGNNNSGDNYFDYRAQVKIDGITHTLWVAASGTLIAGRPDLFRSDEGLAYFRDRLAELDASVLTGKLSGGPYRFTPGKKQGEPIDGEQLYHDYPKILFTVG
jgi:hypothetical protein